MTRQVLETGPADGSQHRSPEATAYLEAVGRHLAHLPIAERQDVLDEVAGHLEELAADDPSPLADRLGSPKRFADELLDEAGYERSGGRPLRLDGIVDWVGRPGPLATVRRALSGCAALGWTVVRGWGLSLILLKALGSEGGGVLPRIERHDLLGPLTVLAGVVLSIAVGRSSMLRRLRRGRLALVPLEIACVLVWLVTLAHDHESPRLSSPEPSGCLEPIPGRPLRNLYAYDAHGQQIPIFFLVDQDGEAVDVSCSDASFLDAIRGVSTHAILDAGGHPIANAYPRLRQLRQSPDSGAHASVTTGSGDPAPPASIAVPQLPAGAAATSAVDANTPSATGSAPTTRP